MCYKYNLLLKYFFCTFVFIEQHLTSYNFVVQSCKKTNWIILNYWSRASLVSSRQIQSGAGTSPEGNTPPLLYSILIGSSLRFGSVFKLLNLHLWFCLLLRGGFSSLLPSGRVRFGFLDLHEAWVCSGGPGHFQHCPALVALQQCRRKEQQRRGIVQTAAGEGELSHLLCVCLCV